MAGSFAHGVGMAVAGLRREDELARFTHALTDPHPGATVAESVEAMAEEAAVDAGWLYEYADEELAADIMGDPALAAHVWVATLAARDDDDAFRLYHRLIGVAVD